MSRWSKIYNKLLRLLFSILIKSKIIPNNPIYEYKIDVARPILYIIVHNSKVDLFTIQTQCLKNNLPDPLVPLEIAGSLLPHYLFIYENPYIYSLPSILSIKLFNNYINLQLKNLQIDVQILPVFVMFGRSPGRKIQSNLLLRIHIFKKIQKIFIILWYGRDSFVRFLPTVSLRKIAIQYGSNTLVIQKLIRVASIHFARHRLVTVGPKLYVLSDLFNKLLQSKIIKKAIEEEARSKKISYRTAEQKAILIMKEIAANFSYEAIRFADRIIGWLWRRLYKGIHVNGSERIRQLAQSGYEIVYIPCHRSHMDYLLISYVLYNQGLVPPHIAAGINLNFWPIGPLFRRLGAFFIRRSFKGNKLYSIIFRRYLSELFTRGFSVEYFIEGGRSRTGRLIQPKTGTILMTLQAMLRSSRPINLVPIYIGYEHVIEITTYIKELKGSKKTKEGFIEMMRGLRHLRNLGQGYVNFGEPLALLDYLNEYVPKWHNNIMPIDHSRPVWITPAVNDIATRLMIRINEASAANAINLCVTALLSSEQLSLTREQLIEQLECYLQLLRNVPYSLKSTVPNTSPEILLNQAIKMNKIKTKTNNISDSMMLSRKQAILMTYYRNNIHHMLVIPSLIAAIVYNYNEISQVEVLRQIKLLYPMLKKELFLRWEKSELVLINIKYCEEFIRQGLVILQYGQLKINTKRYQTLQLLSAGIKEILQRIAITVAILIYNPNIKRITLENESYFLAKRLSIIHGINSLDFYDKKIFSTLIMSLREEGYINDEFSNNFNKQPIQMIWQILAKLLTKDIRITIENTIINNNINK
ncbi:glycerol-3-phosphate 1-O-acyltransferase PlsB [Pantoea sp. Aalb]|uniref:glycerol-3-phosphate 1-O-acyltransferase PlsB n=1 Tax=Pantoea sp. Aalb TaxID=2576762 RepID=UPI00132555C9|nr:glycerol-3-phosphate 1-O-acyltransferase PlsB [Pantoea sp. Aalb]MXP67791.1 glycerol-3-phosphate 1-O-acyltransferase PlsB [Pantoea sp. Aalb]